MIVAGSIPAEIDPRTCSFDDIGRTSSGATPKHRAAVIAPFRAALEVRFPAHPGPALAEEQAAQDVVAERSRLVADPSSGSHSRGGAAVLGLGENRLVAAGALVPASFLDDEAEIHPAAADDVLDRLASPDAMHSLAVAVVHCDVVVSEKHIASIMVEAGLDTRHKTVILTDLAALPPYLVATAH